MNKNILKVALVLSLSALSSDCYAANTSEIENLEKQFIAVENELLTPELRLDDLQKERSNYDSFTGWFQFSKKKAVEAEIEKQEGEVKKLSEQLGKLNKDIQSKVFEVAQSFEAKGDYDKAIEFYKKVAKTTDTVRERIAVCYKCKKDYSSAIKWFLDMKRSDAVMLEVVDCYHLAKNNKESIYWLFQILSSYEGNASEKKALKLTEEYKYADLLNDYPDFYEKLSDVYITKALKEYGSSTATASASYKKAVSLLSEGSNRSEGEISMIIVNKYQSKYSECLEILSRQKDAALRNYEDKVRCAENDIYDAKRALDRAHRDSEHHYQQKVRSAQENLRRAEENLSNVMAKPESTESAKSSAQSRVNSARMELGRVMHDRERIIRDYLHSYERRLRDAIEEKDRIVRNRESFLEDYVAPYKKNVSEAKRLLSMIKSMHSANY